MKRKCELVSVSNSRNINKTIIHLQPEATEHKKATTYGV